MTTLYESVKSILDTARTNVYRAVNVTMVDAYWHIGQTIVDEEQRGERRAEYGVGLLKYLAQRLTDDFGKGFNETSLKYMRLLYQSFPIRHTLRDELSWSHYRLLSKVDNEKDLEQALLTNLQKFMLELGKGFAFVARQQRIDTESSHFYIDLVFYNYMLKCFVLIDLKVGKLTHQDIGQMDMYVRMYEDLRKQPGDNPTIGLVLCSDKDATVVKYSVMNGSEHLFASRYTLFLPTEAELKAELEREHFLIEQALQP